MKHPLIVLSLMISLCTGINAHAEKDSITQNLMKACESDIQNFCSQVTPGEGRLLACIYAHEDKLSIDCQYGMYEAAAAVSALASTFTHIAIACENDIPKHCGNIKPGEGRLLVCMKEKQNEVSSNCAKALSEVELE